MSRSDQEQDRWESCPSGTLVRTVREIRTRQRERRLVKTAGLTGGVAVLLVAALIIAQPFSQPPVSPPRLGPISCATLQSLLPAYIAGKLEDAQTGQVKTHLERCPHCRERYDEERDDTVFPGQPTSDSPQLAMRI